MPSLLLNLLLSKWTWIGLIMAGFVLTISFQHAEVNHYKASILAKDQQISALQQANRQWSADVAEQNKAIEAQKALYDDERARLTQSLADAKKTRQGSNKAVSAILSEKVSSVCQEAISWGVEEAKKLSEEWK